MSANVPNFENAKLKVSLKSLPPKASRFAAQSSFRSYKKGGHGQRTQRRTTLGQREQNKLKPLDPVPTDLLQCHDSSVVTELCTQLYTVLYFPQLTMI